MAEDENVCYAISSPRAALAWTTLAFFAGFSGVSAFGPIVPKLKQAMDVGPFLMGILAASPDLAQSLLRAAEAGSAFSAGADIAEFSTGAPDPEWRARNQASIARVQRELARLPIPTLAVIEGDCVGGGCGSRRGFETRAPTRQGRAGRPPPPPSARWRWPLLYCFPGSR